MHLCKVGVFLCVSSTLCICSSYHMNLFTQTSNATMAPPPSLVIGNFPGQIVIPPTASAEQPWERDTWLVFRKIIVPQLVLTDGPELLSDRVLASLGSPSAVQDQANSHACGAKMEEADPLKAWSF